jgi:TRAP-type mannitol/chloroaromatic compound transport system permease small subunit
MFLRLSRVLDAVSLGTGVIAALLILPLVAATVYEVFSRYVLNAPTIWAYEIAYMGMGAHFLLGAAYTLKVGGHIRIDMIYSTLGPKTQSVIDLLCYLLLLLPFAAWVAWGLWDFFMDAWRFGERSGQSAWNPRVWPFRLIMAIGFILLAIQTVSEILKRFAVLLGEARTIEETR